MTTDKAISLFLNFYQAALQKEYVRNKIAWALYETWKIADKEITQ